MKPNQCIGRPALNALSMVVLSILVGACVAADNGSRETEKSGVSGQPRLATYSCGIDGSITVESLGSAVRVLGTDGNSIDLPASPANQRARFGGSNQAIVLENGEALYMVAGKPTLSCRRS